MTIDLKKENSYHALDLVLEMRETFNVTESIKGVLYTNSKEYRRSNNIHSKLRNKVSDES